MKEPDYNKCSRKLGRFQEKNLTIKEIAQGHLEAIHNKSTIKSLIIERHEREKVKSSCVKIGQTGSTRCPSNVFLSIRGDFPAEWRLQDACWKFRRLPLDFRANTVLTYERKRLLDLWSGDTRVL